MRRIRQLLLCLTVAAIASGLAGSAFAQRLPVGVFDWEARDGDAKGGGQYFFEPGGRYRVAVLGIAPPVVYAGRWEMRQDTVVVHSQDGGEQTFRWDGADLVLIASTTGMPAGRVVLKHHTKSAPRSP